MLTISIMMILIMIGFGMVAPILPIFGRTFGVSTTMVGLLVTSFGVARIFANLPTGRLADRIGRRPLVIIGPAITAVGALLAAVAPNFWFLVATRFIQGIGSAVFATASMTILTDASTPENRGRTMTIYQGALLLGAGFGPSIGGLSAHFFGLRGVFVVYAVLMAIAVAWAVLRIEETLQPANQASTPRAAKEARPGSITPLLLNASFLAVSFASMIIFFTRTGGRSTIIPLFGAETLGMNESSIGAVLTVAAVFNVIMLPFAGWGIDRFGRKPVIVPSLFVSAFGILLFTVSPSTGMFFFAAAILGLGTGIAGPAPAAYAADLGRHQNAGTTMGLFRTTSDFGFVLGPILLGLVADHQGYSAALYVNAALLFLAGLVFGLVARESHRPAARVRPSATDEQAQAARSTPDD